MPEIYGSSRIRNVSGISTLVGPTGSTGPAGATGATGGTGSTGAGGTFGVGIFSGLTGASGGDGVRFFREGEYGGDFITFYLTDGTTLGISGARGSTGEASNDVYQISNTITDAGYGGVFDFKNGITAHFRNLTVSGRDIEINANDYSILLRGVTYDTGILGNTGELLYQFDGLSAHGAKNTYWDNANNNLLARILVHREADDSNTLLKLPTNEQTIVRKDSPGASVAFEHMFKTSSNRADETDNIDANIVGIHLGKTADDAGAEYNWIYHFPGSTFGSIITPSTLGSCCFCEDKDDPYAPDSPGCIDYVTEAYCSSIGGKFSTETCLNRPEGPSCLSQGACCINDICVASSEEKCVDVYGGFFVPDLTCDELELLGDEDNPIGCPNPCADRGSCCINNICYDLTEYECSLQPNGLFFPTPCSITNCCLEGHVGACCMGEVCYETTPLTCSNMGGVFWGIGSACSGPYGAWKDNPNYVEGRYAPYECVLEDGTIGGILNGGNCPDGNPPPCTSECIGWTQVISDECGENICACEYGGLTCPCEDATDEYGCNICGSNTESCGGIVLTDGSCWECCCDSSDATTTTTTEAPDDTTTTQAPYGYCCEQGEGDFGNGCLYYDENGEVKGNCLWRCYLGIACGCAYQFDGEGYNNACNASSGCTTYQGYRCTSRWIDLLNLVDSGQMTSQEAADIFLTEEPYATQCEGYYDPGMIYDSSLTDGSTTPLNPRYSFRIFDFVDSEVVPTCMVGHTPGVTWYDHCVEAAGGGSFPCNNNFPGTPMDCPQESWMDGNPCINPDCCPIDPEEPPFPGAPDGGTRQVNEPLMQRPGYLTGDEARRSSSPRGGGASCLLTLEADCNGTWYEDYNDCQTNCISLDNACCHQESGNCYHVDTCGDCPEGNECTPNETCMDVGCGGDGQGCTSDDDCIDNYCCDPNLEVCLPCGWQDDCCTNPDICPEGWECNTSMCACIQTGGPGDPDDDSGGGPGPDEGTIGEGVWCCNGGMLGGSGCDCASWPTNFCCVYVPIDLNPECIGYDSGPHGTEEECYQSCCGFETEGATWNGPRPCEEETDCNGEQCCCAGYCTNCIQDATDPAGGWICPPKFYG